MERSLYNVLNVAFDASYEEIRQSYRKLALLYHPDKLQARQDTTAMVEVQKAWEILRDDKLRQYYDEKLECKNRRES